ncbi:hypothetical protein NQ317_011117 [Molorchus minor]|uniref:Uncharacterized protein n=1 Tax=Molorchus minor TaxID=1323400 RepID=A0ABQ9K1F3_9CUCU|nr:hypothetical protein NQ317_011117 [Molorchus minor]
MFIDDVNIEWRPVDCDKRTNTIWPPKSPNLFFTIFSIANLNEKNIKKKKNTYLVLLSLLLDSWKKIRENTPLCLAAGGGMWRIEIMDVDFDLDDDNIKRFLRSKFDEIKVKK